MSRKICTYNQCFGLSCICMAIINGYFYAQDKKYTLMEIDQACMKRGNFGAIPTRDIFLEFEHHGPIKFLLKKRVYGTP